MIVGVTGGTGCGKTTALQAVQALGGLALDCDAIYHELLKSDKKMLAAIAERFPEAMENGSLARKKLGAIVFANPNALEDLNAITHAAVRREVVSRLHNWKGQLAAIDAIALFESGLGAFCDKTVAVIAPEEVRIARLMEREDISEDYAKARIAAQQPESFFRESCTAVLENKGTREAFYETCKAFFAELISAEIETDCKEKKI